MKNTSMSNTVALGDMFLHQQKHGLCILLVDYFGYKLQCPAVFVENSCVIKKNNIKKKKKKKRKKKRNKKIVGVCHNLGQGGIKN